MKPKDRKTGQRVSLATSDFADAKRLLAAKKLQRPSEDKWEALSEIKYYMESSGYHLKFTFDRFTKEVATAGNRTAQSCQNSLTI